MKKIHILLLPVTFVALVAMAFGACSPLQYTLSTSSIPAGGGDIDPGNGTYGSGAEVTIRAIATGGYRFDHWAGNISGTSPVVQLVMDGNNDIIAYFTKTYMLSVLCTPAGGGTVNTSGGTYDEGKQVTLTATPSENYKFDGWSIDATSSSSDLTIIMTSNKEIVASFSPCDICIYYGKQPPYSIRAFGDNIQLIENATATDPTWQQLKSFLLRDNTDKEMYNSLTFPCGAFAQEVHNNAEAAGIKAAWVAVDFIDGSMGHALNVFQTTDKGLVYVDCTGEDFLDKYGQIKPYWQISDDQPKQFGTADSWDKIAYLSISSKYGLISLDATSCPDYNCYEKWRQQKADFELMLQDYNQKVEAYNAEVTQYNNWIEGKVFIIGTSEDQKAQDWYNDLQAEKQSLDSQSQVIDGVGVPLGAFWESLGVVSKIEIYW